MNLKKEYKYEFDLAKEILTEKNYVGQLSWHMSPSTLFSFKNKSISLMFYLHKTTAGNQHVRVRNQGSKYVAEANKVMKLLDKGAGFNSTFAKKL